MTNPPKNRHAQMLGKRAKGVKKRITEADRERRRAQMAKINAEKKKESQ